MGTSIRVNLTRAPQAYSIRPASPEDISKMMEIELSWGEREFESEFEQPNSRTLVVTDDETDEQVIGFVVYRMAPDFCEILNVGVHSDFRAMGWATKLVREVIKDALRCGLKKCFLEVRKSNTPAVQLYQKLKFDILRVRKGYYTEKSKLPVCRDAPVPEDGYEMELDLTDSGIGLSG